MSFDLSSATPVNAGGGFDLSSAKPDKPVKQYNIDPKQGFTDALKTELENAGWVGRNLAGAGTAASNLWEGAKQLVGHGDPERIAANRTIANSAPVGSFVGNVATYAPLALVPGANTILGGAAVGAGTGAIQPTLGDESRGKNALIGGLLGGSVPVVTRALSTTKAALVDPFTEAGRTRIAGSVMNGVAADPNAVAQRLKTAQGATPGFVPTVGQAADDAGMASFERTMRGINPGAFDMADKSQRGALVDALRSVAQTPEAKTAAIAARESAVNPLYSAAKQTTVTGDPVLDALLTRPSMKSAAGRASTIAAERGDNFILSQAQPQQTISTGVLDAAGNPITKTLPGQPATYPGQALHDLKMGLDDAIGSPGIGGMQGAERSAALGTKSDYLNWLENKIPEYGQAKSIYADMSKPINQMDIGQELYNRFTPALADQGGLPFKSTAQAYANALRNGDQLAQNVTGMNGVTMGGIMEPEQMALLNGVAKDSALKAAAEGAGRGVGSDTVQKIAMSNIAAKAGIPTWLGDMGAVPGGWLKRAGDVLYKSSDDQVREQLAQLLTNPQQAAAAMESAGANPSAIAKLLQQVPQGIGLSVAPMAINQ